jgi:hypothetical protein
MDDEKTDRPTPTISTSDSSIYQDLLRFFKLYPDHQGFDDLFTWKLDFYRKDFYRDLFKVIHKLSTRLPSFICIRKTTARPPRLSG